MPTIGPLACEVSGGLDSSALLSVAEHLRRDGKLLAPSLDAYTLAFTDDSAANELEYARAVGEHLGIPVHEIEPAHKPLEWYRDRAKRLRTLPSYPNGVMGLTEAYTPPPNTVPEPTTWTLAGLAVVAWAVRHRGQLRYAANRSGSARAAG